MSDHLDCRYSQVAKKNKTQGEKEERQRLLAITIMDILGLLFLLLLGIILCSSYTKTEKSNQVNVPSSFTSRIRNRGQSMSPEEEREEQRETDENEDPSKDGTPDKESSSFDFPRNPFSTSSHLRSSRHHRGHGSQPRHHHDTLSSPGHGSSRIASPSSSSSSSSSFEMPLRDEGFKPVTSGKLAFLQREMLKNTSVTCNDGTTAGYYIRTNPASKKWIVFLEQGGLCFSATSCQQRWKATRFFMTSAHWPQMRSMNGILSTNADENPFWYNANHVLIPYCSSDSWSGARYSKFDGDFSFLGSVIIEQVLLELLPRGLHDSHLLMLAGESAGGVGVLMNLDRVSELMAFVGSRTQVRGLADSGWFLDNKPFEFAATSSSHKAALCHNSAHNCPPVEGIKLGARLWNGQVPSSCAAQYPSEPWRCYFGYRIYPTLRTPIFIVQWIFDQAQMQINSVGSPVMKAQWNYIHNLGGEMRKSLENVTALFAPSCIAHSIITKRSWSQVKVQGVSLSEALRCWELESTERSSLRRRHLQIVASRRKLIVDQEESKNKQDEPIVNKNDHNDVPKDNLVKEHLVSLLQVNETESHNSDQAAILIFNSHLFEFQPSINQAVLDSRHTHVELIEDVTSTKSPSSSSTTTISPKVNNDETTTKSSVTTIKLRSQNVNEHERMQSTQNMNDENENESQKVSSRKKRKRKHRQRHNNNLNKNRNSKYPYGKYCNYHFIDNCNYPSCNSGCSKYFNPISGKEINFVDLFTSLGINLTLHQPPLFSTHSQFQHFDSLHQLLQV